MNAGGREAARRSRYAPQNQGPDRAITALKNILELERSRDFTDRAVMGGLDKFIEQSAKILPWIRDIEPLRGTNYATLEPGQRHRWASSVMAKLRAESPAQVPRQAPPATKPAAKKTVKRSSPRTKYTLDTPLEELKFIHKATRPKLARLEVQNLRDMIRLFPNRHVDYSQVTKIGEVLFGEQMTVAGRVVRSESAKIGPPPGAAKILINDGTGVLEATFFRQAYLANRFKRGDIVAFSGEIGAFNNLAQMQNPEYDQLPPGAGSSTVNGEIQLTHAGNLLPVYPSTDGLVQRSIRTATRKSLDNGLPLLAEFLDGELKQRHSFTDLTTAVESMHYPDSSDQQFQARRRLAFDELFMYQLAALKKKSEWKHRRNGIVIDSEKAKPVISSFLDSLEFDLTSDQQNSLDGFIEDMSTGVPMGRLLQGEVGSGKTVIALSALLAVNTAGHQGALMAPTEVLAEQHFLSIANQLKSEPLPGEPKDAVRHATLPGSGNRRITMVLLIGSLQGSIKKRIQQMIADGEADLIIGTHALLQEQVAIPKLGLAVVDEQHRFGVEQRGALTQRDPRPHLIAMSATPIPRTLSLTVYGDLDITTLKILPEGRKPITTTLANNNVTENAGYELVRQQVAEGRQAFVVCPLIEPSEAVEAASALEEFERLSNGEFKDLRVGLLHGRMKLTEKQDVMEQVRKREIDVLVATPVIEVGVDIPNATVMMIMSANRFGLAQLHQLRGRVGRGEHASHCVLMSNKQGQIASERIDAVINHNDGFKLAEEDLRIRGPGDYMGTRQSGWDELKVATIDDVDLLQIARREASDLMEDGTLDALNANRPLAKELERVTSAHITEFS
ncbi:ATP-dependent DNA helicase RecG [Candidatus Lucifugimonas marina]|uniref:Probable DNA 3'-5' helicase RecG n=1 Tax=Candidatus Lucifugimonas marina TaxID=3038979 RepID=A0AAJ6CSF5_9CHLR|nr:ATP-dependent DNA helicase RecG [SAR202 cluster bacterium JH702]MDG0869595.1 ATP-dependent DNA helicase RecG [SAR202 cluster bacterium JH639]WFG34328.1 ATP-dependent DNA helicase RecG [SAR202 cluster bacterium JH545]WFG38257.1 ATP-dependent DNA helicase RecG [SAR202 cluster bacterium JH1073]